MQTSRKTVVLGTRGSELALTQAHMVKERIEAVFADIEVVLKVIVTTGDLRTDVPLADVAKVAGVFDKGVFLKEIETALAIGEIDLAVHSLKDVPSELAPEFELAAVLPRASVGDVLISKQPVLPQGAHVATGSVRRRRMAEKAWGKETVFSDLRGNVPTRLLKLAKNPELDGIILAKAGLERLGLFGIETEIDGVQLYMSELPLDAFTPAAGQGIIGIEIRKNDDDLKNILSRINHVPTYLCATAERAFLAKLGADCSTPVGVFAELSDDSSMIDLRVLLYRDGQIEPVAGSMQGSAGDPGSLAQNLLESLV